jgi:hypothetical protein
MLTSNKDNAHKFMSVAIVLLAICSVSAFAANFQDEDTAHGRRHQMPSVDDQLK